MSDHRKDCRVCGGVTDSCAFCDQRELRLLRANVARLQADLTRAVSYVGGDDIEDVMEALRKAANDAINHETTLRLLAEAQAERDDAIAERDESRRDVIAACHERDEACAVLAGDVPLSDIAHDDDACRCLPCRYSNALDERDDALATLSLARADIVWVLRERNEANAVARLAMAAGLEDA